MKNKSPMKILSVFNSNMFKALENSLPTVIMKKALKKGYNKKTWLLDLHLGGKQKQNKTKKEIEKELREIIQDLKSPDSENKSFKEWYVPWLDKEIELAKRKINGSSVSCNQSIVMMVTSLEVLLEDIFGFLMDTDEKLQKKFFDSKYKINPKLFHKYKKDEICMSELVFKTKRYNFQNTKLINKTFYWATGESILKHINFEATYRKEKINSIKLLKQIIELRHKIIHEGFNDNSLNYKDVREIFDLVFWIGARVYKKMIMSKFWKPVKKS